MITKLKYQNFKALKNAELKLGMFNVVVGPNGSGKSSILQALAALAGPGMNWDEATTVGAPPKSLRITVSTGFDDRTDQEGEIICQNHPQYGWCAMIGEPPRPAITSTIQAFQHIRIFSFQASMLGQAVSAHQIQTLAPDGQNLVGALTSLRDKDEDAYDRLKEEFQRWLPEYDGLLFDNDAQGLRHLKLRQKMSQKSIPAPLVSEGTLLALALLTIVHEPSGPRLIGLEEPDRGLHPRLLRELRDALYRLSFPNDFGIKRDPVQVVVTTHSPLFLDLFKEHPDQIIIAEKRPDGTATFKNLSDDKELQNLIGDAPLGEVWYSGILGGVPVSA